MEEQLITLVTAKLLKERRFNVPVRDYWHPTYEESNDLGIDDFNRDTWGEGYYSLPTQSLLQKFIREQRGVHIEVRRNASGYFWEMCRSDGVTDLGWSDSSGPNAGGVWGTFEDALENAMFIQLSCDLPENTKVIGHWGNYVEYAIKTNK